ncbi:hypothetical protein [Thalassobaculum sp.]|uniref:hypothetical protein n=1 Tax=Thalassobaculum sp. TaxID=2022740 RepID=UPI0032F060C9
MTTTERFDILPAPDHVSGPTLRAVDMTARQAWQWLALARFRAALDTGQPQGRVGLVEFVLDERGEVGPGARVHAVDTLDPAHMAAVYTARRAAGLPVWSADVPPVAVEGVAVGDTALADALGRPGSPPVAFY